MFTVAAEGWRAALQYVLARIFGCCGALFERSDEQTVFAAVAHAGLGPRLLARLQNRL